MSSLAYASPATLPPRYDRLALGGALLTGAVLIALISVPASQWLVPPRQFGWCLFGFEVATNILILAAVPLIAGARRYPSRRWVTFFTTLAVLHLIHNTANSGPWYAGIRSPGTLLKIVFALLDIGRLLDPLFCLGLLVGASVFVVRLRIPPLTILTILGLAPEFLWQIYGLAFWTVHLFVPIEWLEPRAFVGWYIDYGKFPILLFWLTLTIVALVLAAKSRRAGIL